MRRCFAGLLAAALLATACGTDSTSAADRRVTLVTTACGNASRTSGTGVIVEDGWVLAAAHVVIGAGQVDVAGAFGSERAEIAVLDTAADLALLRVGGAQASPIVVSEAGATDTVQFSTEGDVPMSATVLRTVEIRIEAVRSTERISRFGFEIDQRAAVGDSGGGVFDDDGDLLGIIFGRPIEDGEQRSFAVGHEMVEDVLNADRSGMWSCDASVHRIVEISQQE